MATSEQLLLAAARAQLEGLLKTAQVKERTPAQIQQQHSEGLRQQLENIDPRILATLGIDLTPLGDLLGAGRGVKAAREGEFGEAGIEALFALPILGDLLKRTRGARALEDEVRAFFGQFEETRRLELADELRAFDEAFLTPERAQIPSRVPELMDRPINALETQIDLNSQVDALQEMQNRVFRSELAGATGPGNFDANLDAMKNRVRQSGRRVFGDPDSNAIAKQKFDKSREAVEVMGWRHIAERQNFQELKYKDLIDPREGRIADATTLINRLTKFWGASLPIPRAELTQGERLGLEELGWIFDETLDAMVKGTK